MDNNTKKIKKNKWTYTVWYSVSPGIGVETAAIVFRDKKYSYFNRKDFTITVQRNTDKSGGLEGWYAITITDVSFEALPFVAKVMKAFNRDSLITDVIAAIGADVHEGCEADKITKLQQFAISMW